MPKRTSARTGTSGKTKRRIRSVGAAREAEEQKIWRALEEAHQDVKSIIKQELEGELISGEVLNFRLRGPFGARTSRS